jgi:Trypsin-like peptidase domain
MNPAISISLKIGLGILVLNATSLSLAKSDNHAITSPCDTAKAYTVKLDNGVVSGSGIIFKKSNNQYFVLTSAHLLIKEARKYKIHTPDQTIHSASVLATFDKVSKKNSEVNDIAILKFKSNKKYKIAVLSLDDLHSYNNTVFAAGFPIKDEFDSESKDPGFVCNNDGGKISMALSKSMEEGYQLGYYIDIVRGMSGGPLVNMEGKVIGINGKRSHPLGAKNYRFYKYRDGNKVDAPLDLLFNSSWAIPTKTILTAQKSLNLIKILPSSTKNSTSSPSIEKIPSVIPSTNKPSPSPSLPGTSTSSPSIEKIPSVIPSTNKPSPSPSLPGTSTSSPSIEKIPSVVPSTKKPSEIKNIHPIIRDYSGRH